jgi:hypothetical protein
VATLLCSTRAQSPRFGRNNMHSGSGLWVKRNGPKSERTQPSLGEDRNRRVLGTVQPNNEQSVVGSKV